MHNYPTIQFFRLVIALLVILLFFCVLPIEELVQRGWLEGNF